MTSLDWSEVTPQAALELQLDRYRGLTTSQKAMKFARSATLHQGRRKKNNPEGRTQAEVAEEIGVSVATLKFAQFVLKSGESKLINDVESGKLRVSEAYKQIHHKGLPEKDFYQPFANWLKQRNICARTT